MLRNVHFGALKLDKQLYKIFQLQVARKLFFLFNICV